MRFKKWLQMMENLSGPGNGGTMDSAVGETERLARNISNKGAGAYPQYGDEPPTSKRKSPDANYYPRKMKMCKKKMKKS